MFLVTKEHSGLLCFRLETRTYCGQLPEYALREADCNDYDAIAALYRVLGKALEAHYLERHASVNEGDETTLTVTTLASSNHSVSFIGSLR